MLVYCHAVLTRPLTFRLLPSLFFLPLADCYVPSYLALCVFLHFFFFFKYNLKSLFLKTTVNSITFNFFIFGDAGPSLLCAGFL